MRAATRRVLTRAAAAVGVCTTVGYAIFSVRDRERARAALQGALKADYENLPRILPEVRARGAALRSTLEELENDKTAPPHEREVAEILLYRQWPTPARARFLFDRLLAAGPEEAKVIGEALAERPEAAGIDALRRVLLDESAEPGRGCAPPALWRRSSLPGSNPGRQSPLRLPRPCSPKTAARSGAGSSSSARRFAPGATLGRGLPRRDT